MVGLYKAQSGRCALKSLTFGWGAKRPATDPDNKVGSPGLRVGVQEWALWCEEPVSAGRGWGVGGNPEVELAGECCLLRLAGDDAPNHKFES